MPEQVEIKEGPVTLSLAVTDWLQIASWAIGGVCMAVSAWTHNHHLSAFGAMLMLTGGKAKG